MIIFFDDVSPDSFSAVPCLLYFAYEKVAISICLCVYLNFLTQWLPSPKPCNLPSNDLQITLKLQNVSTFMMTSRKVPILLSYVAGLMVIIGFEIIT